MTPELAAALRNGDAGNALRMIQALQSDERNRFEFAAHEADLLGRLGRHEEELAILGRLVRDDPANPSLRLGLANALKTLGRTGEAVAAARKAIALRSDYGKAWWALADLKTYVFSGDEVQAMEAALAVASSHVDRQNLHFALGRAFEQRGETPAAFRHYADGNAIGVAAAPPKSPSAAVDAAIANFTADFIAARRAYGHRGHAPIFIIGLHRSGSTLIEQILASHPEIEATSELPLIEQILRFVAMDSSMPGDSAIAKIAALDDRGAERLGREYVRRARDYRTTDKLRFIDKMPSNWFHVGLIRLILPNAKIIDARRHPMAAGWSNFRQNFARGATWTYSLESIGHYYREYLRLMRHWNRVLPGTVLRVVNEQLIDDFEPQVRRILDHVGVAFHPACLEFHRSNRPVRSASSEQVRRPINRDGVDQWRAYEQWLGPLKEALGPALEDWQE